MEKLGVAIIGSGGMSAGHADSFLQLDQHIKLMAFTDIDLSRAKARAREFGAPIAVTDYQQLLKRSDIQIISIVSPPFHHFQTIIDSLDAGKHVLCEKPVVMNLAELDQVETAVHKTGLGFGGAFQWRFGASVRQAKALHEAGMFGDIMYASNNLYWLRTREYFDVDWRNSYQKAGGGIVFNLACHGLDALMFILGDIEHVSAELDALNYQMEIEDTGVVILRFKNKALGHVAATVNAQQQRSRVEIIGTKLEAISNDDPYCVAYEPWQFRSIDPGHQKAVNEFLKTQNFQYEPASHRRLIAEFVEAIMAQREPAVGVSEIRRSLQVLTAIYKANRLKRTIDLPIQKDDPFFTDLNPEL
ncbi:MAG TPA: Gfo/Idh/MocA family oxidoreductase [bacterium]|nr:Gfo/Idh/MocA family oxidoreductase [bacterium]